MSPEFERLIGRAVSDKQFRDALLADPEQAAKDGGFALTDDELKQLQAGIQGVNNSKSADEVDQMFQAVGGVWV